MAGRVIGVGRRLRRAGRTGLGDGGLLVVRGVGDARRPVQARRVKHLLRGPVGRVHGVVRGGGAVVGDLLDQVPGRVEGVGLLGERLGPGRVRSRWWTPAARYRCRRSWSPGPSRRSPTPAVPPGHTTRDSSASDAAVLGSRRRPGVVLQGRGQQVPVAVIGVLGDVAVRVGLGLLVPVRVIRVGGGVPVGVRLRRRACRARRRCWSPCGTRPRPRRPRPSARSRSRPRRRRCWSAAAWIAPLTWSVTGGSVSVTTWPFLL